MNVQLKKDFASSVRKQLGRYPVWEPGAPIELGDYGVLRAKTFHKLGNIKAFGISFSETVGSETPYQFSSEGTTLVGAQAGGSVTPPGLAAAVKLSAELQFKEEHGIFITALRSRVIEISELRELGLKLRKSEQWDFNWKFVAQLRDVRPGTIIMGSSAGTTLKIEGASDVLQQFNIGALNGTAGITLTGNAALQVVGINGPILLELCYLPLFFGGDPKQAAVQGDILPDEPYARLGTGPAIPDDEE
jgi:hypothetical protein